MHLHAHFPTEVPDALILAIVSDIKNPQRLVAVGGQRFDVCLLSNDGGESFSALASPCKGLRNAYLNGDELWVCGEYGHAAVSRDGGNTFTLLTTDTQACLFGITKDDQGAVWLAGDGGLILRSVDDGRSFARVPGSKVSLSRLQFVPGLGVLIPTDDPGDLLVCTVDKKGKATAKKWPVDAGSNLMVATRTKTGAFVVVGAQGYCARADGPLQPFVRVKLPTSELLTCCCTRADGVIFAVGMSGGIFCSQDDGRSFSAVDSPSGSWWWVAPVGDDVLVAGKAALMRLSTQPQPAVQETPNRQAGVLFSSVLRRWVYPWRGVRYGEQADKPSPLPTREAAWTRLRDLFWSCTNERAARSKREHGIWQRAAAPERAQRHIAARLRQADRHALNRDEAHALVALAFDDDSQATRTDRLHDALADWLVAELGIVDGVSAAFTGLPGDLPYSSCGLFGRLRELVALDEVTSDADYNALCTALPALLETLADENDDEGHVNDLYSAAAFVLPPSRHQHDVERQLLDRAMQAIGKFGDLDIARPCLLASVDDDGLQRFLKANPTTRHELFATVARPYLATCLARGSTLLKDKLPALRPCYDSGVTEWALLLAHVDTEQAVRALERQHQETPHPSINAALRWRAALAPKDVPNMPGARLPNALTITEAASAPATPRAPTQQTVTGRAARFDLDTTLRGHVNFDAWQRRIDTEFQGADAAAPLPLLQLKDDDIEAYVALREALGLPSESELFFALPERMHARLLAAGFALAKSSRTLFHVAAFAKHGQHLLPLVRALAADESADAELRLRSLLPIGDELVARLAIPLFAQKKHKALARSYLQRHPAHSVAGALALLDDDDATNDDKAAALRALRYLDAQGARPTIEQLATKLRDGSAILKNIDDVGPVPSFTAPAWLATITRPDGIDHDVIAALSISNPDELHPLVLRAQQRVDAQQGAAYASAIFSAWLENGAPPATSFCLLALGLFGDDKAIADLGARAPAWPSEGAAVRAQLACEALRLHGSATALSQLSTIMVSKAAGLKKAAAQAAARLIEDAGGSADDIVHLLPPVYLDDALDFGGQRLTVVAVQNALFLAAADGTVSANAPKKHKGADPDSFAVAQREWKRLQKAVAPLVAALDAALQPGVSLPRVLFEVTYQQHPVGRLVLAGRHVEDNGDTVRIGPALEAAKG